jgi:hypothetical protein
MCKQQRHGVKGKNDVGHGFSDRCQGEGTEPGESYRDSVARCYQLRKSKYVQKLAGSQSKPPTEEDDVNVAVFPARGSLFVCVVFVVSVLALHSMPMALLLIAILLFWLRAVNTGSAFSSDCEGDGPPASAMFGIFASAKDGVNVKPTVHPKISASTKTAVTNPLQFDTPAEQGMVSNGTVCCAHLVRLVPSTPLTRSPPQHHSYFLPGKGQT